MSSLEMFSGAGGLAKGLDWRGLSTLRLWSLTKTLAHHCGKILMLKPYFTGTLRNTI